MPECVSIVRWRANDLLNLRRFVHIPYMGLRQHGVAMFLQFIPEFSDGWRGLKFALVGLIAMASTACSSVDLLYTFADDVLESRARDLLDVSASEDSEHLDRAVDALFDDHRRLMVPRYSEFLSSMADALEEQDLSREHVDQAVSEFRRISAETTILAAPHVADVLIRHTTPERVSYFEARLAERRAEREAELAEASPEDYRTERIEKLEEGIERFIPDLTESQMAILADHVDAEIERNGRQRWLLNTERRHAALCAFLSTQPEKQALVDYFITWTTRSYEVVDPDYQTHSAQWWDGASQLFYNLVNAMEAQQRNETAERLRSYAEDFAALTS